MANNRRNRIVVPEARQALNEMKNEIARELGVNNDKYIDRGNLTSRENGYLGGRIGGKMTKKLVSQAEEQINGSITNK